MPSLLTPAASLTRRVRAGEGATSVVYRARDAQGRTVACKVARDRASWGWVEAEAERLAWQQAPGLPELLGVGRWEGAGHEAGAPFLVLSWIDGVALRSLIERGAGEGLAELVAAWVGGALSALERGGLSHGDVKPENILVSEREGRAWLLDLGLGGDAGAREIEGGTPRYLAPEARAGGVVERRLLDRYALGEVLKECGARGRLRSLAEALSSPSAQARPSLSLLPALPGGEVSLVRGAYARVRRAELQQAARAREVKIDEGTVSWLGGLVARLRAVAELRGEVGGEAAALGPLGARGRQRWLSSLVGPAAAVWPSGQLGGEAELGAALEALAVRRAVGGLTFAQVQRAIEGEEHEEEEASFDDDVALAVALSGPAPPDAALAAGERRVRRGGACEGLVVALIDALRRRGQPERALLIDGGASEVLLSQAEAARRARSAGLAWEKLREAGEAPRALPIAARLCFDEGRVDEAIGRLRGEGGDEPWRRSAAGCEVMALCLSARGELGAAREAAEQGQALARSDEERARLLGALGYVEHGQGDARSALAAFAEAAQVASRAGAVLEEATYRTGEAACAIDAGDLGAGMAAAQRAVSLWDALGRPREGARALLSHAAALRIAGAAAEATRVASEARACAEEGQDARAQGYALLVLIDAQPQIYGAEALDEATRLLAGAPGDELRCAARALALGRPVDRAAMDRREAPAVARIEWWGARAAELLRGAEGRADEVLGPLERLCDEPGPAAALGEALHAGRKLALLRGEGRAASRLGAAQREAAARLLSGCPAGYRAALMGQPWVSEASLVSEERGGARVEAALQMVRSLSSRDQLRPLLEQVVDALILWTGVERGLLLMPAPGQRLVPRVARNLSRQDLRGEQIALSKTLSERAIAERRPVVAVDAAGESRDLLASVHVLKLRSVLAVPLVARGEVLGVVYLDDRVKRGAFGPDEIGWVELVAGVAATAIADARDQVLLRRAARKARRAEAALAEALSRREAELDALERSIEAAPARRGLRFSYEGIIGASEAIGRALRLVDRVAPSELPVLLLGETGTGKELFARAIHANSRRSQRRFVCENCSAIPESLLETTLFGHARGAFTGADRDRAGLFEVADAGTLFLDEIGEMPLSMQAKLLRVLQDGEVRRVGGAASRKVDVRVVAATHRDLAAMVREGKFREDLYFRLRVIEDRIPPLRERPEDIPLLVKHFIDKHGEGRKIRVSSQAMERLMTFGWPGNVRQLENSLRAAIVLSDGVIERAHLNLDAPGSGPAPAVGSLSLRERVDSLEAELIREAMARTHNNQSRAAELLGVSRFGLQKMLKRLQITP